MHSTSRVTCPSNSSGMVAIPEFYETPRPIARRFEVEDLASVVSNKIAGQIGNWRFLIRVHRCSSVANYNPEQYWPKMTQNKLATDEHR